MNHWIENRKQKSLTYKLKIWSHQLLFPNLNIGTYVFPIVEPKFKVGNILSFTCDHDTIIESIIKPGAIYDHNACLNVYTNGIHKESWALNDIKYTHTLFTPSIKKMYCQLSCLDIPNIKSNFIKSS